MSEATRFWLAVGTPENWHTAFGYGGIWGLKSSQQRYWDRITENSDLCFFYVTKVSGVVGYGIIRTKLKQQSPLWPEELALNKVIWPLRFEFDAKSCLAPRGWSQQAVTSEDLKARVRSGFQELEPAVAQQLLRELPGSVWPDLTPAPGLGRGLEQLVEPGPRRLVDIPDLHDRAQQLLAEIGRLQNFVADTEYPLESRRLDVVWRRVQRAVPGYVFEVQIGGNLTEALAKLKHAYDLWNSRIFLVGKGEHRQPAQQLADGTFREIQQRLRFVELAQVEELYQRKQAYRDLENQLGILG